MKAQTPNTELAWAAGLWDGEGNARVKSETKNGKEYSYPYLQMTNTNQGLILRFRKAVGVGPTYGPYSQKKRNPNHNDIFRWQAYGDKGLHVARLLWPWLSSEKREQLKGVFGVDELADRAEKR